VTLSGRTTYVAFAGASLIAAGSLPPVALAAHSQSSDARRPVRIFAEETGEEVQLDLSGSAKDVLSRLGARAAAGERQAPGASRGPGRPKLGVVSTEVTLLPRHWAWLAAQRGSVSATLRRVIDEARHLHEERDAVRRAQDSAYRFVHVMAGNEPTFEEAIRALYRGDAARFDAETAPWPPDVRDHSRRLATGAFPTGGSLPPTGKSDR
jgi:hypothetical protein